MKGKGVFLLVLAGWGLIGLLISTTAVEAAPGPSEYAVNNQRDFRSRRGFKTVGLATARGFGKRTAPSLSSFSSAFQDEQNIQQQQQEDNPNSSTSSNDLDTFPVDWLVNYLQNKPSVIRYLVEHLLDHNGDGQVTSSEMISSLHQD